jgi:predicted permease
MDAVLAVGLPIFGLIFAGLGAGKAGILGMASSDALNRFVYWFALPAMLFNGMFRAPLGELIDVPYLAAYLGGVGFVYVLGLIIALRWPRRSLTDASILAMTAAYANVGYMGLPLCALAFGDRGLPPVIVATVVTAALLFAGTTILVEADLNRAAGPGAALRRVARALATNPLLLAPIMGGLWVGSGAPLPAAIKNFMDLMGAAASPCALFALGLFLAGQSVRDDLPTVGWLVALKLIVMPAVTWILAFRLIPVSELPAVIAVLLNALPIGAGAFVMAAQYGRQVAPISAATLISTIVSVVTVSALMAFYVN